MSKGSESQGPTESQAGSVFQAYLEERRQLLASELEYAKSFDQWMLIAAGTALGLSMTFATDVVPLASAAWVWLLALGWLLQVVCVWSVLTSLHVSQSAFEAYRTILDDVASTGDMDSAEFWNSVRTRQGQTQWEARIDRLNQTSIHSFTLGLVLMVLFVVVNII